MLNEQINLISSRGTEWKYSVQYEIIKVFRDIKYKCKFRITYLFLKFKKKYIEINIEIYETFKK